MAFPVSAVLDNFNRADGALGANWGGKLFSGNSGGCTVVSNRAQCTGSQSDYWSAATFGPDCEVHATFPNLFNFGPVGLFLRVSSPGTASFTGYEVYAYPIGALIQVYRIDNGSYVQLGSDISQSLSDGDSVGMEMIGDTIQVYYKSGAGAWSAVGPTFTDSTYTGAGYLGMEGDGGGSLSIENFGGGVIASGPTVHERAVSFTATTTIATAGQFFSTLERSTSLTATASITTSATFFSTLERSVQVSAAAGISVSGLTVRERSISLSAVGAIVVSSQFFSTLERSVAVVGTATISVSGGVGIVTEFERSASVSGTATVSISGGKYVQDLNRVFTVGSPERQTEVGRASRTLTVVAPKRIT